MRPIMYLIRSSSVKLIINSRKNKQIVNLLLQKLMKFHQHANTRVFFFNGRRWLHKFTTNTLWGIVFILYAHDTAAALNK